MKVGDLVTFKGLWLGEIEEISEGCISIVGNGGIFISESFYIPNNDEIREHLKDIHRKISQDIYSKDERTSAEIAAKVKKRYLHFENVSVLRMVLDALKPISDDEEAKIIYQEFINKIESKIGKIY